MPGAQLDVPLAPFGATLDAPAVAAAVAAQARRHGTHALPGCRLDRLAELRRRHGPGEPLLDAFLSAVLARHEGRFHNRTYLALPLLERVRDAAGLAPGALAALLLADVVRFELHAAGPDLPDAVTRGKRVRHALRFVELTGGAPGALPELPATEAARWFALTVLPVSGRHDEVFFVRCLQAHEMLFTVVADEVVAAASALRAGRPDLATAAVERTVALFTPAATLFRVVATLRAEAFHDFRRHTEGASAIQSEQYKRFEAACGRPAPARLGSAAFDNVPDVRAAVEAGQDTLCDAYRAAGVSHPGLDRALAGLEAVHQRWKTAHRGLAARMLGDETGSGYTAGVSYLQGCLANRLFGGLAA